MTFPFWGGWLRRDATNEGNFAGRKAGKLRESFSSGGDAKCLAIFPVLKNNK